MGALLSIFANWQTTVAGLGVLVTTLTHLFTTFSAGGLGTSLYTDITALIAGFGLIFAKDANKSNSPTPVATKAVAVKATVK